MKHFWLSISRVAVESEREQCRSEGREMHTVETWFDQVLSTDLDNRRNWPPVQNLFDQTIQLPLEPDFKYTEPSSLKGIVECRSWDDPPTLPVLDKADIAKLNDQVYGAWAGRCAGCLLGLPFEGWMQNRFWGLLKETEKFPLTEYFKFEPIKGKTDLLARFELGALDPDHPFVDQIGTGGMPEDDELNYTVMNLMILRKYGPNVTSEQIGEFWLENLPVMHTQAAECLAYRNLCLKLPPPESATYRNPYREWNGAAIRGDFWGYVAAGDPEKAAEMAYRDASITHIRNGIYAAMWIAAMTATAFVTSDIELIIRSGLARIPQDCRLTEAINQVFEWKASGKTYDEMVAFLHTRWEERREYCSRHAVANAQVIATALLWGDGEFGSSICKAVQAGFETDSNGATVGSIMGILHGRKAIPVPWIEPLRDNLHTGVGNIQNVSLTNLTQATIQGMVSVLGRS